MEDIARKRRVVPAREDIVREGDPPGDVRLVMDGFAYRYKLVSGGRRAIMAILIPGDFCDLDVAILNRMDHSIAAFTPCSVVDISRASVEELTANHPNISHALRWVTLVDEATLREWLVNMGQRPADRQLAHFICEMRLRLEIVGLANESGMHFPLTQEDIADTLGISAVHVNRVLHQLREQNLLHMQGRSIAIPDLAELEKFAEFHAGYLHLKTGPAGGAVPSNGFH